MFIHKNNIDDTVLCAHTNSYSAPAGYTEFETQKKLPGNPSKIKITYDSVLDTFTNTGTEIIYPNEQRILDLQAEFSTLLDDSGYLGDKEDVFAIRDFFQTEIDNAVGNAAKIDKLWLSTQVNGFLLACVFRGHTKEYIGP